MITYTSSKEVISKLYRELNLQSEDRVYAILEFIGEALEFLNAFPQCEKVEAVGGIDNYQLPMPSNYREILGITSVDRMYTYRYDSEFALLDPNRELDNEDQYRYQESGGILHFPIKTGTVLITYTALPLDEEGFPMIPDNISFKEAITKYCIKKLKYSDWLAGRINDNTYIKLENDWNFYCRQAKAVAITPNVDKMDELITLWKSIIPNVKVKKVVKKEVFHKLQIDPRTIPSLNRIQS